MHRYLATLKHCYSVTLRRRCSVNYSAISSAVRPLHYLFHCSAICPLSHLIIQLFRRQFIQPFRCTAALSNCSTAALFSCLLSGRSAQFNCLLSGRSTQSSCLFHPAASLFSHLAVQLPLRLSSYFSARPPLCLATLLLHCSATHPFSRFTVSLSDRQSIQLSICPAAQGIYSAVQPPVNLFSCLSARPSIYSASGLFKNQSLLCLAA